MGIPVTGDLGVSGVPYFAQWESAELASRFADGSLDLADDPRWAASGARTAAEYGYWANKVCGLACLKMILASRGEPVPPMMTLVERALNWKAYIPQGDRVAGLIYRPFADWVAAEYGIGVEVAPDLPLATVTALASARTPVIASVHAWIRWPDREPPARGGHLVLVTGAGVTGTGDGLLRLHNPSGISPASQCDALVPAADFARFYAGRGMLIARLVRRARIVIPQSIRAAGRMTVPPARSAAASSGATSSGEVGDAECH
jgi:hypothetical protein